MATDVMSCKDYQLEEIWSKEHQRIQCIEWIATNKYKNVNKNKQKHTQIALTLTDKLREWFFLEF